MNFIAVVVPETSNEQSRNRPSREKRRNDFSRAAFFAKIVTVLRPPRQLGQHATFLVLNSSSHTPIPVVCAVIEDSAGRLLVAQRPAHKHLGLKWEFPGGKVEANEEPASALIREIREELGCDLHIVRALPGYDHDYTTVVIHMLPFLCRLPPGSPAPHPHEHAAIRWVTAADLPHLDLAPADVPLLAHLADETRHQPPP